MAAEGNRCRVCHGRTLDIKVESAEVVTLNHRSVGGCEFLSTHSSIDRCLREAHTRRSPERDHHISTRSLKRIDRGVDLDRLGEVGVDRKRRKPRPRWAAIPIRLQETERHQRRAIALRYLAQVGHRPEAHVDIRREVSLSPLLIAQVARVEPSDRIIDGRTITRHTRIGLTATWIRRAWIRRARITDWIRAWIHRHVAVIVTAIVRVLAPGARLKAIGHFALWRQRREQLLPAHHRDLFGSQAKGHLKLIFYDLVVMKLDVARNKIALGHADEEQALPRGLDGDQQAFAGVFDGQPLTSSEVEEAQFIDGRVKTFDLFLHAVFVRADIHRARFTWTNSLLPREHTTDVLPQMLIDDHTEVIER